MEGVHDSAQAMAHGEIDPAAAIEEALSAAGGRSPDELARRLRAALQSVLTQLAESTRMLRERDVRRADLTELG